MNREEAYTELNNFVLEELESKKLFEQDFKGRIKPYEAYCLRQQSSQFNHIPNETYDLNESNKIKLVKHHRYGIVGYHDHEFFEIAYLFHGNCSHQFRSGKEVMTTPLTPGGLVIIPPGLSHKISIMDDSLMVNILIHTQTFQSAFLAPLPDNNRVYEFFANVLFNEVNQSYILLQNNSDALRNVILDLYIEQTHQKIYGNDIYSQRVMEHLLHILFLEVIRNPKNTMELSHGISRTKQLATAILLYLDNNYQTTSLQDIADHFNFSKTYINRILKAEIGITAQQHIKLMRLYEAQKLLKNTDMTVARAAELVGYHDTSYFIEAYKHHFGYTPGNKG